MIAQLPYASNKLRSYDHNNALNGLRLQIEGNEDLLHPIIEDYEVIDSLKVSNAARKPYLSKGKV